MTAPTEIPTAVSADLVGGEVDREVPGMRAHLEGCPACAEDFRSLRDLVAADQEAEG